MIKVNLEKIKRLRKSKKLSQGDMAKIVGFNSLYPYHRKESGIQDFTANELYAIANFFEVPIEYFFENDVAKNATETYSA